MSAAENSPRPEGTRRPQARGVATRARLLRAAEELFTRTGFAGTAIGDIARHAGVGVGTVYHHFADKRSILLALIDAWADRLEAQPRSDSELERLFAGDVRESFGRRLSAAYERLRKRPSLGLVALAVVGRDPEVAERYRRIEALEVRRLRESLEYGVERGALRPDLDVAAAATVIHIAIEGAVMQVLVREDAHPAPEPVVAALRDMICRYILDIRD